MPSKYLNLSLALLLCLAACGDGSEGTAPTSTTTTTQADTGELSSQAREAILADAAAQIGVAPEEVEVVSVEAEVFNDTSLGCPEAGETYAQVLTRGFHVIVDADGNELDYRVDARTQAFRLCEQS